MKKGSYLDITGQRFGVLTALEPVFQNNKRTKWRCQCTCGNYCVVTISNLRNGHTKSCGCLISIRSRECNYKHGDKTKDSEARLYRVWRAMKQRCNNPNNAGFAAYGGRGISVCEEWKSYPAFKVWAMKTGYNPVAPRGACTLDRINVNGNYEPNNCRWVDQKTQVLNSRRVIAYRQKTGGLSWKEYRKTKNLEFDGEVKEVKRDEG